MNAPRFWKRHAKRLQEAFRELGWTQEKLHEATGVGRPQLSQFVRFGNASLHTGGRIAIALAGGIIEKRGIKWNENP